MDKYKKAIEEIKERMDGDIWPDQYWNMEERKKYPKFPEKYHNALVDYVIAVWSEIGTIIDENVEDSAKVKE